MAADPLAGRAHAVATLNPEKIYVENVRSVLGVSRAAAVRICETAVRQGVFSRRIEVLCPDDAVVASAATEQELPVSVRCWLDLGDGIEEREYRTSDLKKATYYRAHAEDSVSGTA